MTELIKVLAKIELFSGENMLRTPVFSKYRPAFYFSGANTKISGRIDLINKDSFMPGAIEIVQITFLNGMISNKYFRKGEKFIISEGGKYDLGKGEILEVLSDKV